ncbi:PilT domain protein [Caldisphaera lagunensis DSM 15908]|uniref:PilT domain protein n=1 Tax=Caldisphaera lagunensis (strain DSM 15908 / JCM 11604 / ANMR 0165 / IC-154) TaxID=1056495 RepID=L0A8N6_CALLD|nr:PilT domain-containing protein [Caldisphaera lagunensis]AFZ70233.1 PilT domain protein [Caldisphaera lagunensis DSM 15908]
MTKVILDSNMIIMLGKGIITISMFEDLLEQKFNLITTSSVIDELKKISEQNKNRIININIKFGLNIIKNKVEIIETKNVTDADDSIFYTSLDLKNKGEVVFVATNDRELRSRLRIAKIPTIYYRDSKSKLELEWKELD